MTILFPAATAGSATTFPKSNFVSPASITPLSVPINIHRPFLAPRLRLGRLHAALSPQPPNSQPDPPPPEDDRKGIAATFTRFQDRVQIFFAVLFWMSLFFWASAWDGRNRGGSRPNKGSRFRR
ncbi:uncharacterized protein LOC8282331 [Ricinus communis]|uniref:Uncharacterized protein n=1 Tax=Ricinus communis TaxID=3988 RepID=B9RV61_RICCO|nr:uncharacterized protein LOC8282331 [Ricinus communis]EEF44794.1 conserved hypothetical protein [Ricinus communis]|eukprot:XP_002517630.1 uncharacterized protein LOC8282331 [Ricinus communis]